MRKRFHLHLPIDSALISDNLDPLKETSKTINMTKELYRLQQSQLRASLNGVETHTQRVIDGQEHLMNISVYNSIGSEIWQRGADMLEAIKGEMKDKLDLLWERDDDEPAMSYEFKMPKMPLGSDNKDFEPGYFESFTKNVKTKTDIIE